MSITIPNEYYNIVANIESGGNPSAVSSTSSASGLFGFIGSTANALGGNGLQQMETLTQQNAQALVSNGLDVTSQNLYTLHLLGQGQGLGALTAPNSAPLSAVVDPGALAANPQLQGMTVGQFTNYTAGLVGGTASGSGSSGSGSSSSGSSSTSSNGSSGPNVNSIATDVAEGNIPGVLSDLFGGGSGSSSGGFFSWIENLFSAHTATRFAFVVIGIILVGVAIVYLAANSDTGKVVIQNVKEGTKQVASTVASAAVVAA